MATDILDELFYGRLAPWEKIPRDDSILSDLIHRQSELSVQLEDSIGAEHKGLLAQYMETRADLETRLYCHYFKMGFLMGAKFAEQIHP